MELLPLVFYTIYFTIYTQSLSLQIYLDKSIEL